MSHKTNPRREKQISAYEEIEYPDENPLSFFNAITETVLVINREGTILAVNEAGERNMGIPGNELCGRSIYEYCTPEVEKARKLNVKKVVHSAQAIRVEEELGGRILDSNLYPLVNKQGTVESIVIFSRNITEGRLLKQEIVQVSDDARQMIGHELHDELGQVLTGVAFRVAALDKKMKKKYQSDIADLRDIAALVNDSIRKVHYLCKGSHCIQMDYGALEGAIRTMAADVENMFDISCRVECIISEQESDVEAGEATHLFYIAMESVTNSIKHGKAKKIIIRFVRDSSGFHMSICDNGTGENADIGLYPGMGLHIMKYRAEIIGARFETSYSSPETGFEINVTKEYFEE
ncbi:MAG: PAS domain-containing protein [bacterium]|nr:PAS domain-containing protein [bacterium]